MRSISLDQYLLADAAIQEGKTLRVAAAVSGLSKSVCWRIKHNLTGPRKVADVPLEHVEEYVCPGCNYRVYMSPCVICAARMAQEITVYKRSITVTRRLSI